MGRARDALSRVYAAPSGAILGLGIIGAFLAGSVALFLFAIVAAAVAAVAPAWAVLNARGDAAMGTMWRTAEAMPRAS